MDHITQSNIREWIKIGKNKSGCTHVIVVHDAFNDENYPVFVMNNESAQSIRNRYNSRELERVVEIYDLSLNIE